VNKAGRLTYCGVDASNSSSESLHASSTYALQLGSTIRFDHCVSEGQTPANNDFGRQHTILVVG